MQPAHDTVVKADHGGLLLHPRVTNHRHQGWLDHGIDDGQALDLDCHAHAPPSKLEHLLEAGDPFAAPGVELLQFPQRTSSHEPLSVGGADHAVVVDHRQPSVGGEMHIALNDVDAELDRGSERCESVLGVLSRIPTMAAEEDLSRAEATSQLSEPAPAGAASEAAGVVAFSCAGKSTVSDSSWRSRQIFSSRLSPGRLAASTFCSCVRFCSV